MRALVRIAVECLFDANFLVHLFKSKTEVYLFNKITNIMNFSQDADVEALIMSMEVNTSET